MRTTVTLDPDTEQLIRRRMRERGLTFKQAINEAIRQGCQPAGVPFRTQTASLGRPTVPLGRAPAIAAELEDDELIASLRRG